MLESFVKSIEAKQYEEITYEYEGFYKDLMEESIPEIRRAVETLRKEGASGSKE